MQEVEPNHEDKYNPYQSVMSSIQTKPVSPGSECQKDAACGRNRAQTCTETDALTIGIGQQAAAEAFCGRPRLLHFTSLHNRITSQTWNRGRKTRDGSVVMVVMIMKKTKMMMMAPESRKRAREGRQLSVAEPPQGPPPRTYSSPRLAPTANTTTTDMLDSPPPPSAHRGLSAGPLLQVCPGWSRCVAVVRLLYIPNSSNPEKSRSTLH